MKFQFPMTLLGILLSLSVAAEAPTDPKARLSYSIGQNIGNSLKQQEIDLDVEMLLRGLQDVVSGNESLMTSEEIRTTLTGFQEQRQAEMQAIRQKQAADNLAEGQAFLAENGKKEGVVTLESGLQYQIIEEGSGKSPAASDTVTTHYRGTLIDGTEFDSSYSRGEPTSFPVNGVIAGWTEALQLMKEGAKWKLFIPADLAYGERGAGGKIGPNATLIFDIELISIDSNK